MATFPAMYLAITGAVRGIVEVDAFDSPTTVIKLGFVRSCETLR